MLDNNFGEPSGKKLEEEAPFPLTEVDKWVLSQTDEEFHLHSWDELREIIATNKLETLKRRPSDLRRYMAWSQEIKGQYGSMTNYLLQRRLPWGPPPFKYISSIPFHESGDYRILINDWPYGLSPDVTHIVVWSKTPIPTDERTGDVIPESKRIIQEFVDRTFVAKLNGDSFRVMWFKNWVQLQSVRALEHVHILIKDARKEDLEFWTGKQL